MKAIVVLLVAAQDFPPRLPGGVEYAKFDSHELLNPPRTIREGISVARKPPSVDMAWSAWGDSLCAGGKYYASIGDHLAPGGNAYVYEYDPVERKFRLLVDVRKLLGLPEGHYTPGKIHGRLDLGADGRLYFSTHRGSAKATTDQYHAPVDLTRVAAEAVATIRPAADPRYWSAVRCPSTASPRASWIRIA